MKKLILGLVITSIGSLCGAASSSPSLALSLFGAESSSLPLRAALSKKKIPGKFELDILKDAGITKDDFHLLLETLKDPEAIELFACISDSVQIAFSHLISSDTQDAALVISLYQERNVVRVRQCREWEALKKRKNDESLKDQDYDKEFDTIKETYDSKVTFLMQEWEKRYGHACKDLHYRLYNQAKVELDPSWRRNDLESFKFNHFINC